MLVRTVLLLGTISTVVAVTKVMLFYETLCPHSAAEMRDVVPDLLERFGSSIFISLVPYGNAVMTLGREGSMKVDCQHGENECIANAWHACSHLYMSPKERVEYAICTMSQGSEETMSALKTCTSVERAVLMQNCSEGQKGIALTMLMADLTEIAGPVVNSTTRHINGVPTFFVDGFPITPEEREQFDLWKLICMKAKSKPLSC